MIKKNIHHQHVKESERERAIELKECEKYNEILPFLNIYLYAGKSSNLANNMLNGNGYGQNHGRNGQMNGGGGGDGNMGGNGDDNNQASIRNPPGAFHNAGSALAQNNLLGNIIQQIKMQSVGIWKHLTTCLETLQLWLYTCLVKILNLSKRIKIFYDNQFNQKLTISASHAFDNKFQCINNNVACCDYKSKRQYVVNSQTFAIILCAMNNRCYNRCRQKIINNNQRYEFDVAVAVAVAVAGNKIDNCRMLMTPFVTWLLPLLLLLLLLIVFHFSFPTKLHSLSPTTHFISILSDKLVFSATFCRLTKYTNSKCNWNRMKINRRQQPATLNSDQQLNVNAFATPTCCR